jgi:hypothetical protein
LESKRLGENTRGAKEDGETNIITLSTKDLLRAVYLVNPLAFEDFSWGL